METCEGDGLPSAGPWEEGATPASRFVERGDRGPPKTHLSPAAISPLRGAGASPRLLPQGLQPALHLPLELSPLRKKPYQRADRPRLCHRHELGVHRL